MAQGDGAELDVVAHANFVSQECLQGDGAELDVVAHANFVSQECRQWTFDYWPKSRSHPAKVMSEAGYFYTPRGDLQEGQDSDQVTCFCCGCTVEDWDDLDSPLERHAMQNTNCVYYNHARAKVDKPGKVQSDINDIADSILKLQLEDAECDLLLCVASAADSSGQSTSLSTVDQTDGDVAEDNGPARKEVNSEQEEGDPRHEYTEKDVSKYSCKVCYEEECATVLVPCGHLVCASCTDRLEKCHICRQAISQKVPMHYC